MTAPTQSARERLLAELSESPLPGARYAYSFIADRLDAIEAEAIERERARLAEKVEGLEPPVDVTYVGQPDPTGPNGWTLVPWVRLTAVLALLDEQP